MVIKLDEEVESIDKKLVATQAEIEDLTKQLNVAKGERLKFDFHKLNET